MARHKKRSLNIDSADAWQALGYLVDCVVASDCADLPSVQREYGDQAKTFARKYRAIMEKVVELSCEIRMYRAKQEFAVKIFEALEAIYGRHWKLRNEPSARSKIRGELDKSLRASVSSPPTGTGEWFSDVDVKNFLDSASDIRSEIDTQKRGKQVLAAQKICGLIKPATVSQIKKHAKVKWKSDRKVWSPALRKQRARQVLWNLCGLSDSTPAELAVLKEVLIEGIFEIEKVVGNKNALQGRGPFPAVVPIPSMDRLCKHDLRKYLLSRAQKIKTAKGDLTVP